MNNTDKTRKERLIRYIIGCLEQYLVPGFPVFASKQDINQAIEMLKTILYEQRDFNSKNRRQ